MADVSSDDEFGSYDPTTPKPQKKTGSRSTKPANAVAGPSSKPVPAPKRGVKRGKQENGGDVEMTDLRSDNEVQETAPPPKKTKSSLAKAPVEKTGPPAAKAKGKGKASGSDDVIVVGQGDPRSPIPRPRGTKLSAKTTPPTKPQPDAGVSLAEYERTKGEVERLKKQLSENDAVRQKLVDRFEELVRLRETEPEAQLNREREVYEAKIQKLELLRDEQATLISGSNSGFLHFLSREDADKEKKEAEDNVLQWKKTAAEKDQQIKDLHSHVKQLEQELKLEVDRAKSLAARNPPTNGRRGGTADPDDRTQAAVISLYEALSNILVVNASIHPGEYSNKEERVLHCIYSAPNSPEGMIGALNFSLREMWQPDPETAELVHKVEYLPKDLDKEQPDLVQKLEFFGEPFIFAYDQLHVFFKTLSERFEPPKTEEEEEEEEVEDVVVAGS